MKNPCYPNDVLGQWTPNKLRTSGYWIKKIFTGFGAGIMFWKILLLDSSNKYTQWL